MKFPRNARIFRGQLDFAPFAAVLFLLVIFVLLGKMLYTPGVPVRLPTAGDLSLPGAEGTTLSAAVTTNAIYFQDEQVSAGDFSNRLAAAKQKISEPLTLILRVDKDVTAEKWMNLWVLAQQTGISNLSVATMPRVYDAPPANRAQP